METFREASMYIKDALTLVGLTFFWVDEIVPRVNDYRRSSLNDPTAFKHGQDRDVPLSIDKWDWFDRQYVENYFCSRMSHFFRYSMLYDPKEFGDWQRIFTYNMTCELNW